jgi:hypothetical protein
MSDTDTDRGTWERSVRCRDGAGRERELVVFVSRSGHLALKAPPGEVAEILPPQIQDLVNAIDAGSIQALTQRMGP